MNGALVALAAAATLIRVQMHFIASGSLETEAGLCGRCQHTASLRTSKLEPHRWPVVVVHVCSSPGTQFHLLHDTVTQQSQRNKEASVQSDAK